MEEFSYVMEEIPPSYKCSECGASGCKLWRQYQVLANAVDLLCVDCAIKNQTRAETAPIEVGEDGKHTDSEYGFASDNIGWLVPAVPVEDERQTYWGYTSVPENGVKWWVNLPLRATALRSGGCDG